MDFNLVSEISKHYFESTPESVNAVAYGYMYKNGIMTQELGLVFSVNKKLPIELVPEGELIPKEVSLSGYTFHTDVVEQQFKPLQSRPGCPDDFYLWENPLYQVPNRLEIRPLKGGVGTTNVTTLSSSVGTLGFLAIDNDTNSLVAISNNHVWVENGFIDSDRDLSDSPENILNNVVVQPHPSDDNNIVNHVGVVKKYVPLQINGYNYADVAASTVNQEDIDLSVSYQQLGFTGWTSPMQFATSTEIDNLLINKNYLYSAGRTTGAKGEGEMKLLCSAINQYTVVSPYRNGDTIETLDFARSIVFVASATTKTPPGTCPYPIAGGDSGSVLIADIDGVRKIVGICYAGSTSVGLANRIDDVADRLNIRAWTGETNVYFSNTGLTQTLLLSNNSTEPFIEYESKTFWQAGVASVEPEVSSSPTPTVTPTLTKTPLIVQCGNGVTTGTYYFYDCCGYVQTGYNGGVVVTMDYNKPYSGVEKLNSPAVQVCPSPTTTPTPTNTPTITSTQTLTPTNTPTPSLTPTNTPYPVPSVVLVPKNECDVFTLFDMAINCYTIQEPSTQTSFDGQLRVLVTGGTPPYQFTWDNGQKTQTIVGLRAGQYGVRVVDYYGDYTATTICTLFNPTPSPTVTSTSTPTPTPSVVCQDICFTIIPQDLEIGGAIYYGPWQFVCNGVLNGKKKWNYNSEYNIIWVPTKNRWEMVENDFTTPVFFNNGTIVASTSTSDIPLNLWSFYGNQPYEYTFDVQLGTCLPTLPFICRVIKSDTECGGTQNCNGSIIFAPSGGLEPYFYSINNGFTYSTNNIFNSLCSGVYLTKAEDSNGISISRKVTINVSGNYVTYNIKPVNTSNKIITNVNSSTQEGKFEIQIDPPLPIGTTVRVTIQISAQIINQGPWKNDEPNTTASYNLINELTKNGASVELIKTENPTTVEERPNCSPELQQIYTEYYTTTIDISHGDIITGTTLCELEELNPVLSDNGCVSTISSNISIFTSSPTISGCYCCTIVNSNESVLYRQRLEGDTSITAFIEGGGS